MDQLISFRDRWIYVWTTMGLRNWWLRNLIKLKFNLILVSQFCLSSSFSKFEWRNLLTSLLSWDELGRIRLQLNSILYWFEVFVNNSKLDPFINFEMTILIYKIIKLAQIIKRKILNSNSIKQNSIQFIKAMFS